MSTETTICALATANGPAAIAIVRLSGSKTAEILSTSFKGSDPVAEPRKMVIGDIYGEDGAPIDHCLAVFFSGNASFTGEDSAEVYCHGSPLIVQKIVRTLIQKGARLARPGEFSERAFRNGKLDLLQAEAVADLISAGSEQALKLAQEQLSGRFTNALSLVGEPLRDVLAELEASIDFPEEDIALETLQVLNSKLQQVRKELEKLLGTYKYAQVLKDGLRVLLCGKPNAGKSSVLNMLLGKRRALVSAIPGTTRDFIEEALEVEGYRFVLCDSAGIHTQSSDPIEKMGIELALERVGWADLIVLVCDATDPSPPTEILELLKTNSTKLWLLINKIDLCSTPTWLKNVEQKFARIEKCSALTQQGVESIFACLIEEILSNKVKTPESSMLLTNERQRACIKQALKALDSAFIGIQKAVHLELISADVREALKQLEEIVGATYTEDILGRIFSKFCIGK